MNGAPRSAYADDDFVMIRGEAVRALGDYHSAGVFQRIAWRCERKGAWKATVAEIAGEVWLSEKQVRKAVAHLREVGWVTGNKTHPMDNTLTWRVTWAERPTGNAERPVGHMDGPTGQVDVPHRADIPYSQTETEVQRHIPTTWGDAFDDPILTSIEDIVGGFEPGEEAMTGAMLSKGATPAKVLNTIEKRRAEGGVIQ